MAKKNTAQAPLTPAVLHILLALSTGERHGYGIMKQVQADSQGKAKMGPGTLYGSMGRMMETGLIRESNKRVDPEMDDQRRIYYKLTSAGRAALEAELTRYRGVVRWRKDVWRMATNVAGRRYRTWYAMLLRLYPRLSVSASAREWRRHFTTCAGSTGTLGGDCSGSRYGSSSRRR